MRFNMEIEQDGVVTRVRLEGYGLTPRYKRITQLEELVRGKLIIVQRVVMHPPYVSSRIELFQYQGRLHPMEVLDYSEGDARICFEDGSKYVSEYILGCPSDASNSPAISECWIEN